MRHIIRNTIVLAALLCLFSCVHEPLELDREMPGASFFTGTLEFVPLTRTVLDAEQGSVRNVLWTLEDAIVINGQRYNVSSLGNGARSATFVPAGSAASAGSFKAWYPMEVYNGGSPALPSVQVYSGPDGSGRPVVGHLPMYAETSTANMEFRNLCAVFSFEVTGSMPVDSLVVTSKSKPLSGAIRSVTATGALTMDTQNTYKRVKLDCSAGGGVMLDPDTPTEFFVAVPPGTYSDLLVDVYSGETVLTTLTQNGSRTLERSNVYAFDMDIVVESMQLVIITSSALGKDFFVPFHGRGSAAEYLPAELIIDWGDGSVQDIYPRGFVYDGTYNYKYGGPHFKHTYEDDGEYTITITSFHRATEAGIPFLQFRDLNSHAPSTANARLLKKVSTPLSEMDSNGCYHTFRGCTSLTDIPEDVFSKNGHLISMTGAFAGCTGLTEIPAGLFGYTPLVESFNNTFFGCTSLTVIPAELFSDNLVVTTFEGVFLNCTGLTQIPEDLFSNNLVVDSFRSAFAQCGGLTAIPAGLFDNNPAVTDFTSAFYLCTNLTAPIPIGLFDNNPEVKSFGSTFANCKSMTGDIPAGLFDNNPAVEDFSWTFANCEALTGSIPAGLFDNNPAVTTFCGVFSSCKGLIGSIPNGLFDHNPAVKDFSYAFSNCSGLTESIPTGLFDNNPAVESFKETFRLCSGLTGPIPAGLFDHNTRVKTFESTFSLCSGLTGSIPPGLFNQNTEVTSFHSTFASCGGLTGSIPAGLFDNNQKVTTFSRTFTNTGLTGSIPAGLFDHNPAVIDFYGVFETCPGLNGSIPAGLFDHNPAVLSFGNAFWNCSGLTGIPAGLFDHNPAVTNFGGTFNACRGLTGPIPAGLFDHNPAVIYFNATFGYCSGITEIPAGLFDHNPAVTDFHATFIDCSNLVTIPSGLFQYNLAAYKFYDTFGGCPRAVMPADIFIGSTQTSQTRFASLTYRVYIGGFFGLKNETGQTAQGGTVPDLWNYYFPAGYVYTYANYYNPFYHHTNVTNWNDIPSDWK